MRKILAIRFSALGDVVLALRALPANAQVHFLTKQKFAGIARRATQVHSVHTIGDHATLRELFGAVQKLKLENYDAVLDLHSNLRSRIFCLLLKTPVFRIRKPRLREMLLFLLRAGFWKRLGFPVMDRPKIFRVAVRKWERARGIQGSTQGSGGFRVAIEKIKPRSFIAIAPDSAWRQKEWPLDRFAEVARRLMAQGESVAWLGLKAPSDALLKEGVKNYVGVASLEENMEILASAKVLLCNDAGLMHLAEAVGTPVLSLFGPTSRELGFAPSHSKSRIIEADLWCRPCSKSGKLCFRVMDRRKCLKEIKTETVLKTLDAALRASMQESFR